MHVRRALQSAFRNQAATVKPVEQPSVPSPVSAQDKMTTAQRKAKRQAAILRRG